MSEDLTPVMTPARWQRIKALFDQALEREPGQRAGFLTEVCATDTVLRAEVETLLEAHHQAQSFIEQPAAAQAAHLFDTASPEVPSGQLIGPYRILREIGRGGMGQVYLAERADGQFEQRVALKLIAGGFNSAEVERRFRQERQILASLNHPNIARLLDGGTAQDGRLYFVMEYIEGEPLDQYCDRLRLNIGARLRLFNTVCAAVEHAHSYLVVHRDLKPGNILITADGTVKLLDFGIAKLLNPELVNLTLVPTGAEVRLMTPEYASPEQVRGETITRASDVYALGVILYELLTGHRPYRLKSRLLHEVARVICEEEPTWPSEVASRKTEAEPVSSHSEFRLPAASLRGDLDNIVLMALRKEPLRRYQSAAQLAEDIRRSLDGEPVSARQDTLGYRTAKFIRRHRFGVAALAAILLTLVVGMVATTRQARLAERRFNDVRQLANTFLFTFDGAIERLPGATPARRLIVNTALEYLNRLAREAGGDDALQRELAAAYIKVGDLQGNPNFPNLGDLPGAEQSYRQALALREALAQRAGQSLPARRDLAQSYERVGDILYNHNELTQAERLYQQAREIREAWAAGHSDRDARSDLAKNYDKLGLARFWQGDTAGARTWYQKGLSLREALATEAPQEYVYSRGRGVSHINLGDAYVQEEKYEQGLAHYEQARQFATRAVALDGANAQAQRDLGMALSKRGEALTWASRLPEALAEHRAALAVRQRLALSDPSNKQAQRDLAISHTLLGVLLAGNRHLAEGQAQVRQAVEIFETMQRSDATNATATDDLLLAYNRLGHLLGDNAEGLSYLGKALALAEQRAAADPQDTNPLRGLASTTQYLAEAYARLAADQRAPTSQQRERWERARTYFQRHLQVAQTLQQRQALSQSEAATMEKVRKQLAACEAALARLAQQ
jgi:eukaryotic-like serine/threonine-protein kinase